MTEPLTIQNLINALEKLPAHTVITVGWTPDYMYGRTKFYVTFAVMDEDIANMGGTEAFAQPRQIDQGKRL